MCAARSGKTENIVQDRIAARNNRLSTSFPKFPNIQILCSL